MASDTIVRVINALRAEENSSLLQQLTRSAAFISQAEADEAFVLQELADEERLHQQWLDDLLDRLDATPGPLRFHMRAGSMGYHRIESQLPALIVDKQRLIAEYAAAAAVVADEPEAARVVGEIAARHQAHLARLEVLQRARV
jgi:rubrerythrin